MAGMTPGEIKEYMNLLGQATDAVMTPDAKFVLLLLGPDGMAHYVTGRNVTLVPSVLRQFAQDILDNADRIEKGMM